MNAIRNAELTGAQPNDLYDRRDLLLDKLSEMGQVSVTAVAGRRQRHRPRRRHDRQRRRHDRRVERPGGHVPADVHLLAGRPPRRADGPRLADRPLVAYQQSLDRVAQMLAGTPAATGATTVNDIYRATTPACSSSPTHDRPGRHARPQRSTRRSTRPRWRRPGQPGGQPDRIDIAALRAARPTRSTRRWSPRSATRSPTPAPGGHRAGADGQPQGPPRERVRRVARRGDDEPHPLPARLPSVLARDVHDGRDARPPDQPHRPGGPVATSSRITNNMVSRSVLTDLNDIAARQAATRRPMSSARRSAAPLRTTRPPPGADGPACQARQGQRTPATAGGAGVDKGDRHGAQAHQRHGRPRARAPHAGATDPLPQTSRTRSLRRSINPSPA